MEGLLILLGGAYVFVLPVLTLLAWSRSARQRDQLEQLRSALIDAQAGDADLQRRLDAVEAALRARPVGDAVTLPELPELPVTPAPPRAAAAALASAAVIEAAAPSERRPPAAPPPPPVAADRPEAAAPARPLPPRGRPAPAGPSAIDQALAAAKAWLLGGNTFVRLGMVLVFIGLAFLLRYASDRVVIPLEWRYLGVALTALVALSLGWRLRRRRPAYALLMQGGAVAVMYLTVFAALKLHGQPLLASQAGFALLVAVVGLSGVLAVAQNALGLAVAGALGCFAAPLLVSTGGGNHVALFGYLALLDAGILGIAWFRAWRPLNLIGFFGTFVLGLAWGLHSYDPASHYASSQAFLLLFFLLFVAIGLLFARRMLHDDPQLPASRDAAAWLAWLARHGHTAQRYVDGTLLFGTPLAGFGLQYGLIRHIEDGTAFSALALGGLYLSLAWLCHRHEPFRYRLLTETYLALGMIFASLAIPLGLDAQWTSAAWAVEGAGIYWLGHRQGRPLARAFAVLLQAGAAIAFLQALAPGRDSVLAGSALGALMLGAAFLANLAVLRRSAGATPGQWDSGLAPLFATVGLWSLFAIAPLQWSAGDTAIAWALAGLATVWGGLRLQARGWLANGFLVQFAAGALFLGQLDPGSLGWRARAMAAAAAPFAHAGFWTPALIALAAFASAWGLHLHCRREDAGEGLRLEGDRRVVAALLWSIAWWALAWQMEWQRLGEAGQPIGHLFLATMAASALLVLPIIARWRWVRLAALAGLLLPLVALVALVDYRDDRHLLAAYGWAAFGLALAAAFALLRIGQGLLGEPAAKRLHLINCWVWLGVASLEARHLFLALGAPGSAWRWLGWVLPLVAWMLWAGRHAPPRRWPAASYPALYRFHATAPLLVILLAWLVMVNLDASGSAAPLPFVPLLNPLELALMLVLFAGWQWTRQLAGQDPAAIAWQAWHRPLRLALLAGVFLSYSGAVLRAVHHLAGVPWRAAAMQHSMLVQASLSLAWAVLALGLMIAGHRQGRRSPWIAGAVLVAVVVGKLFLIELSNRGGLERIVSFIGVGVLLLVVGYFAPLPPRREEQA